MMELHRAVIHRDGTGLVLVVLDFNNNINQPINEISLMQVILCSTFV